MKHVVIRRPATARVGVMALSVALAAAAAAPARGQTPPPAAAASGAAALRAADAEAAGGLARWVGQMFALPAQLPLDPSFRAAAQAVGDAHIARMNADMPGWMLAARAAAGAAASDGEVAQSAFARMANEVAVWRVGSGGPAHDAAVRLALDAPGACMWFGRTTWFGEVVSMFNGLPQAQRNAALAGESALLQRWGQPRDDLPPRPPQDAQELVRRAVDDLRAGKPLPGPAMLPGAAATVLDEQPAQAAQRNFRCALQQWWLRRSPAAASHQALHAFRFATLPSVRDLFSWMPELDAPAGDDPYPLPARRFHVTGTVGVELRLDAAAGVQDAEVVRRDIQVAGMQGQRPVLFEALLDEASIQRARALPAKPLTAAQLRAGGATRTQEFVWRLE